MILVFGIVLKYRFCLGNLKLTNVGCFVEENDQLTKREREREREGGREGPV